MVSENNFWTGKASYMKALTPDDKDMKFSALGNLQYNRRTYRLGMTTQVVGDGFDAEAGFVPRRDYLLFNPLAEYRWFLDTDRITQISFFASARWFYKLGKDDNVLLQDFGFEESNINADVNLRFVNNQRLNLSVNRADLILLDDFDPTRIQNDDIFLNAGSRHQNLLWSLSFNSDNRKNFSFRINPRAGQFFGGWRAGVSGRVSYRVIPYMSIAMQYSYNRVELGNEFVPADLWLLGPKLDVTFSKQIFWTTFVQYNNQSDNLNINSRLQWRFAPVSDFFLVYTHNYNVADLDMVGSRNRALVAKLTYWLNT